MPKRKKWACLECKPSKEPCEHLEALLPSMETGSRGHHISDAAAAAMTMNAFQVTFWSFDPASFIELMRNYGITDKWDLDLLTAKYCRNLSAADVAKEQSWVSPNKVKRRLKYLRDELVRRGFEQELE